MLLMPRTFCAVAVLTLARYGLADSAQERWADSVAVERLYEQAKDEGGVVIWGSQNRELSWIPNFAPIRRCG